MENTSVRDLLSILQNTMLTLGLSVHETADMMNVSPNEIGDWLRDGVPDTQHAKLGAVTQIADILSYRLKDGAVPEVVRTRSAAYGDRTVLEVLAADEHEQLLALINQSFDFHSVA